MMGLLKKRSFVDRWRGAAEDTTDEESTCSTSSSNRRLLSRVRKRFLKSKPVFTCSERTKFKELIISKLIEAVKKILSDYTNTKPFPDSRVRDAALVLSAITSESSTLSIEIARAITVLWENPYYRDQYEQSEYSSTFIDEYASKCRDYPFWGGRDWFPSDNEILKITFSSNRLGKRRHSNGCKYLSSSEASFPVVHHHRKHELVSGKIYHPCNRIECSIPDSRSLRKSHSDLQFTISNSSMIQRRIQSVPDVAPY
mmetsp:Transcript_2095/g.2414  ORF Transcript_2095/g.2414 Transcript_2095/m.2414 type:complete len:256 (+) Transcript_2095:422-1189(+)